MDFRCAAAGLLCKAVDNPNFGVPCIECNKVAHAECGESFYNQSTTNITANQLSSQARVLVDVYAQSPDNAQLCVNCIIDIQRRIAANNNTQAATATATGATMGNGTSTNYSTQLTHMTSAPMLQYLIPHGGGSLMPHGGGSLKSRQSHCGEGDVPVQEPSTMLMMLKIVYQLSPSSDGTHLYDNVDADADNLRCSSRLICRQSTA